MKHVSETGPLRTINEVPKISTGGLPATLNNKNGSQKFFVCIAGHCKGNTL